MYFFYCLVVMSYLTLCDPWKVTHQAPLSMGFSRQKYWSGLPFPFPEGPPDPRIKLMSPALVSGFFTTKPPGTILKKIREI